MDDRQSFEAGSDTAASGWSARNVRAIKAAVYIMGVLIVIGAVALVAAIVMKAERGKRAAPGFGELKLAVPAGASISGSRLDGDRLIIDVTSPQGGEVVIVDVKKGEVLGRVKLEPAAK